MLGFPALFAWPLLAEENPNTSPGECFTNRHHPRNPEGIMSNNDGLAMNPESLFFVRANNAFLVGNGAKCLQAEVFQKQPAHRDSTLFRPCIP